MSHFRPVALEHASRLLNHGPTILITSRDADRPPQCDGGGMVNAGGIFSTAYCHCGGQKAPRSRELIERSGMFGIVVPGVAATNWSYAVGSVTGRDEDKFNCYGIPAFAGPVLGLPVIGRKMSGLGWSVACCLPPLRRRSTTRCLAKWCRRRQMTAPL